ncbi:MAG TPA: serine hydrolase domain-containing protein [Actinocrinis sp.]|jgi:CubicO group peptidase (beta-lactamase class C family)
MDEESGAGPAAAVRLVEAAVESRIVSAAVLAVGRGAGDDGDLYVFGRTRLDSEGSAVTADTLFDLASLTKVVATAPAVLRLADAGELGLDDPVARYLPAYSDGPKADVTLRHLLTHSSGLPPHRWFHEMPGPVGQRLAAAAKEPLTAAPGTQVVYSDIGYILLGAIIAQVAGVGLDQAARELVFEPLGLKSTGYLPSAPPERFAATEIRPETGEPVIGTVHDENAEALGGVAGHAGVFSTVGDMVRYLRVGWLDQDCTFLSERSRAAALACGTEGLDGRRGLGWTLAGDRWDHMTAAWPRTRAGHTGFTGTSLALDPAGGLWTVLLTNAVHLGRDHSGIALLRRTVHAAVAAWAETLGPGPAADPADARDGAAAGYDQPVRIQGD